MTAKNKESIRILIPPEFEYFPVLFLPDPARAQWVAGLCELVARMRHSGYDVSIDAGSDALTAAETASQLATHGISHALLAGLPCDSKSVGILSHALEREDLKFSSLVLGEWDTGKAIAGVEKRVRDLIEPASAPIAVDDVFIDRNVPFMIFDANQAGQSKAACFIKHDNILRKNGTGSVGSLPAYLEEIHLMDAAHPLRMPDDLGKGRGLFAFALTDVIDDPETAFDHCSSVIGRAGPEEFRMLPLRESVSCGGAEWAARLGLHRDAVRVFLERLTTTCFPSWKSCLNVINLFYSLGEDPLEEMYAGNSLPDRNAELIENIVP